MNKLRLELLEKSLQSCINEYKDKIAIFNNLDTKAQNNITIAGIFLGAMFAFLQGDNLGKFISHTHTLGIFLIGLSIISLIISIGFCLYALKIRTMSAPLESDELFRMAQDILKLEDSEFDQTISENFLRDQISVWPQILKDMYKHNEDKAIAISRGQTLIAIAIIIIASLSLIILITNGGK